MSVPRVVALGVDAADANLVRRWAGEGHLPTFATLLETSLVAPIATPVGVLEGGIWPTLLSSSSPATHGMFAFQSLKAGTYDIENGMRADRLSGRTGAGTAVGSRWWMSRSRDPSKG